jgi:hypothetical protein
VHEPLDEAKRPIAKRKLRSPRRSKQIRDERKVCTRHVGEEECWAAGRNYPPMDFRRLQVRVNLRRDLDHVVIAAEAIEKSAEIREH